MSISQVYSQDDAFNEFFEQTTTDRSECDRKALELVGGSVEPIEVQGVCSYTVYAGANHEHIVQFRLQSLPIKLDTVKLAQQIYGKLVPNTRICGSLGEDSYTKKQPLDIYHMDRVKGITHLNYILAHGFPEDSESALAARKILLKDIAKFMAISWISPQQVETDYRQKLQSQYAAELQLLLHSLPERFSKVVQHCIDQLRNVMSLPMVLLHHDFGTSNILIDEASGHLTGVIDWAEAEICPFGQNLHSLEAFSGTLKLNTGWKRYKDYDSLHQDFWETFKTHFKDEWSHKTRETIQTARTMGLLLSRGFTKRLANLPPPKPIEDDALGKYNLLWLDGLLLDPSTRFNDIV